MSHSDITITIDHPLTIDDHRSIEYGILLAMYLKSTVHLLHIIRLETLAGVNKPLSETDVEVGAVQQMQRRTKTRLEALRRKIEHMSKQQVPVEIHVAAGYRQHRLAEYLQEWGQALTVIGREDLAGTWEPLWGNALSELVARHETNLLVVPEEARFRPLRQVLYLFQGEVDEREDLQQLQKLVAPFDGHIQLMGLVKKEAEKPKLAEYAARLRHELGEQSPAAIYLEGDQLAHKLKDHLSHHPAQLLAVHQRHQRLLSRLTQQDPVRAIAFDTDMPLLIFKEGKQAA